MWIAAEEILDRYFRTAFQLDFFEEDDAFAGLDPDLLADLEDLADRMLYLRRILLKRDLVELQTLHAVRLLPEGEDTRPGSQRPIAVVDAFRRVGPDNVAVLAFDELAEGSFLVILRGSRDLLPYPERDCVQEQLLGGCDQF